MKSYWDQLWTSAEECLPHAFVPGPKKLRGYWRYAYDQLFRRYLEQGEGKRLIEIGGGGSVWISYFSKYMGYQCTALDYSEQGCSLLKSMLDRDNVEAQVILADMFNPPQQLLNNFDVIVSLGVVEHFDNLPNVVAALKQYAAPNGKIFTLIPNMRGFPGWLQKTFASDVYNLHTPYGPEELRDAHLAVGLHVEECAYVLGPLFSVVNLVNGRGCAMRRTIQFLQTLGSLPFHALDLMGLALTPNRWLSPYVLCTARLNEGSAS